MLANDCNVILDQVYQEAKGLFGKASGAPKSPVASQKPSCFPKAHLIHMEPFGFMSDDTELLEKTQLLKEATLRCFSRRMKIEEGDLDVGPETSMLTSGPSSNFFLRLVPSNRIHLAIIDEKTCFRSF